MDRFMLSLGPARNAAKMSNDPDSGFGEPCGDKCALPVPMKKTCRDIMTKDPFCCEPADSAQTVAQLMRDRNVGAVLICESQETKRLVGIVTDRDLTLRIVAAGCDPKATCAGDVMTPELFTCSPEDDVQKALELMERHQVRRIPVVDQENRIVGIITQGDIAIRLRDPQKIAEVVVEVSKPSRAAAKFSSFIGKSRLARPDRLRSVGCHSSSSAYGREDPPELLLATVQPAGVLPLKPKSVKKWSLNDQLPTTTLGQVIKKPKPPLPVAVLLLATPKSTSIPSKPL